MADLQCPAIVVLAAPADLVGHDARALERQHLAGVFVAAPIAADPEARTSAARLAEAAGCAMVVLHGTGDGPLLRRGIDELSDLHRGETVWVVAPPALIGEALGRGPAPRGPVTVAIDSSGWTVIERPPG
jgi:hypothetical protein